MELDKPLAPLNSLLQVNTNLSYNCKTDARIGLREQPHTNTLSPLSTAETAPPNFIQRLQSMTVTQGSQVRLDVRVAGIPTPVIKFYREGAEIQSSADFQIVQEGDLYSLLIAEAFPEDSGTYSVNASNSSGRATSTAELLVQGKRLIRLRVCVCMCLA